MNIARIFYFMSSAAKSVLGDHLLSDVTMKTTTYNRRTIPHVSYIHIHTLGLQNQITNITKTNKIHKTNSPETRCHQVIGSGSLCSSMIFCNIGIVLKSLLLALSS